MSAHPHKENAPVVEPFEQWWDSGVHSWGTERLSEYLLAKQAWQEATEAERARLKTQFEAADRLADVVYQVCSGSIRDDAIAYIAARDKK